MFFKVHGGADKVEVFAHADKVRVRTVTPEDRVGKRSVAVVAGSFGCKCHGIAACRHNEKHWNQCGNEETIHQFQVLKNVYLQR